MEPIQTPLSDDGIDTPTTTDDTGTTTLTDGSDTLTATGDDVQRLHRKLASRMFQLVRIFRFM